MPWKIKLYPQRIPYFDFYITPKENGPVFNWSSNQASGLPKGLKERRVLMGVGEGLGVSLLCKGQYSG